ncbi:MAG TPA: 16S rRNA (cytidine(1402)-2'-O)-methyltransferase [Thermoanaerobaculaceae bacterium]|nr:16S rRNA (cytidine(1402)-2'-O)-methyltransferase [Thermoanaerobaculaceae bacterium]
MRRRAQPEGHRAQEPPPGPGSRTTEPDTVRGKLFVVATPIGNLGELSPRAREVLAAVRLILAEDTRRVRKLLNHFSIRTPTRALHEHNETREVPRLLADLAGGADLALVSDAGTPLLADPGYRLVRGCRERGIPVLAVAGPSAVGAALAVSGLPPVPFTFAGFLPPRAAARDRMLAELARLPHTLVVFVSPHRLRAELQACAASLGPLREGALLAELTKVHERCQRGTLAELAAWGTDADPRGEFTLVVGPPAAVSAGPITPGSARAAVDHALALGLELGDARREAARALGIPHRELYALLMRGSST